MEAMKTWAALAQPDRAALRRIEAGRLKGKSDINPQWRYKVMTEIFGLCGVGWKYVVTRKWTEPAGNQVFAFVDVDLYVKVDGEWSDPIPGTGGNFLIEQEKAGPHANDEAYKMATTDAIGNAMKYIGVAADVFLGNWDGSKYRNPPETTQQASQPAKQPQQQQKQPAPTNEPQKPKSALDQLTDEGEQRIFDNHMEQVLSNFPEADRSAKYDTMLKKWRVACQGIGVPDAIGSQTRKQFTSAFAIHSKAVDDALARYRQEHKQADMQPVGSFVDVDPGETPEQEPTRDMEQDDNFQEQGDTIAELRSDYLRTCSEASRDGERDWFDDAYARSCCDCKLAPMPAAKLPPEAFALVLKRLKYLIGSHITARKSGKAPSSSKR